MKSTSKRSFNLESLENRVMLSSIPLTEASPLGSEVFYWQESRELQSSETVSFELDVRNIDSMTIFCASGQGLGSVGLSTGNYGLIRGGYQMSLSNLENRDSVTIEVQNTAASSDTFVFYAVSGGVWENEFLTSTSNDSPATAQTLLFEQGKSAVVGQLENGGIDYYRFTAKQESLNAQLYSTVGQDLNLRILDKEQNILGVATTADGLAEVLSSVKLTLNEEYYLAVSSSSSLASETGELNYALTLSYDSFNVDDTATNAIWNTLSATGVGHGKLEGLNADVSEEIFTISGAGIRAMDSDGTRMALVATTNGSVTLLLLEYSDSSWQTVAMKTWDSANADGVDPTSFGTSISISGTDILVGDSKNDFAAIFSLQSSELVQQTLPSDGYVSFGAQVLLNGSVAFVSAPEATVNGQENAGMIRAFQKNAVSGEWERMSFKLPGEAENGAELGTRMAWNSASNELCFSSSESNQIFFYRQTATGFQFSGSLQPSGEDAQSTTNFGRSIAIYGDALAVGCVENGVSKVRVYARNGDEWRLEQTIGADEEGDDARFILNWGASLSLTEGQLAIGSQTAVNENMENNGIVRLYSRTGNAESPWRLTHSIQHDDDLSLGQTVILNQNRLDVLDPLRKAFYSITDFVDADRWELNVTDVSQDVSFLLSADGLSEASELVFLLTAPDGSCASLTPTVEADGLLFTFTPEQTGEYQIVLYSLDSEDLNYSLRVTSGNYGNTEAVGELYLADWDSGTIVVEYAQQILVSSLETAPASLGGKALELQGVWDGNKVVWSVPDSFSSREYELIIDGLKTVSGNDVSEFRTTVLYSGGETVTMERVCADGTDIQRGTLTLTVNSNEEQYLVKIPAKKGTALDYAVFSETKGLTWTISEPVFDESGEVYLLNVSASMPGTIVIEAVLGAELMDETTKSLTFSPLNADSAIEEASLVGTLNAGNEKELTVTVGAGETVSFVLTDNAGNLLGMSLRNGETQIAAGAVWGTDENGQKILNLKNDSGRAVEYVLRLENETERAVKFEVSALKNAVWESDWKTPSGNELQGTPIVGDISSTSGFQAELATLSLTAEQHKTFGKKTVVSGSNAVVSGSDYVVVFVQEGGQWVQKTIYETSDVFDLALDGNTLAVGHNGSVDIFELSDGALSKVQTLEAPEAVAHQENNLFGIALALDGDTLAVAARAGNFEGAEVPNQGCVFVYSREADGWKCAQQITSSWSGKTTDFGLDLALEDDMLAITGLASSAGTTSASSSAQSGTLISIWRKDGAVWSESSLTVYQEILSNSNLQIQNGKLFFSGGYGAVYVGEEVDAGEESSASKALTISTIAETGLSVFSFSASESGEMVFLSVQDSSGNYYWVEYQFILGAWFQTSASQGKIPAYSLSCSENGVLAACPQLVENGTAYVFHWNSNFDCDTYWVSFNEIPTEETIQIRNADGSEFSGEIYFLNSEGARVQLSEMTVGEIYQIQVFPTYLMTEFSQRYVLSASGTFQGTPGAELILPTEGDVVRETVSSLTLKFSESVDLSTLRADQASVRNGMKTLTASSFKITDGATVEFVFSEALTDGDWTLTLADSLKALSGEAFELDGASFTVDTVPATVVSVAVNRESGQIVATFSESTASAVFELRGELSGYRNDAVITKSGDGKVWTLTFDGKFEPDRYRFSVNSIVDQNGNVTETGSSETFAVETDSLSIEASDWVRATLDGSFAQKAELQGFVSVGKSIQLELASETPIAVKYPENYSGEFTAVWQNGVLTIAATEEATDGSVFKFEVLKNSFAESSENATELAFAELVSASLNDGKAIRQTSVLGKICSGQTDRYSFSVGSGSSISAALTKSSSSDGILTLKLYEGAENRFVAESTGPLDTVEAWISSVVNASSAGEFILEVGCSGGTVDASTEYRLVVTENAVFNGVTNGSLDNALSLENTVSAVGHVSTEVSVLQSSSASGALSGSAVVAAGRFLFVGAPGDSEKGENTGKVTVYEFDGIEYRAVTELFSGEIANASFGASLVLDGQTLVVAAPDVWNADGTQGAIYFFDWNDDGSFDMTKKVTNPFSSYSGFGYVMDYSDGMLVVGSNYYSNAGVFIFNLGETEYVWNFLQLENMGQTGENAFFGYSVAVNEEWIAIGAPQLESIQFTSNGKEQTEQTNGAVFYLKRSGDSGLWSQVKIETSQESDILLGYSIAESEGNWGIMAFDAEGRTVIYSPSLLTDGESDRTVLEGTEQENVSASMSATNGMLTLSALNSERQNTLYVLSKNQDGVWETTERRMIANSSDSSVYFASGVSTAANGVYFLGVATQQVSGVESGAVYVLDAQSDFYRLTARNSQIQVTFWTEDGNAGNLDAVLIDSSGNQIAGTEENGTFTFLDLTENVEYFLKVSLKATVQEGCDYVMTATGVSFSDDPLLLTEKTIRTSIGEFGLDERLDGVPGSLTLTFDEALTAGRLSTESVRIFNGKEEISAERFELSQDGKSVTFYFSGVKYETLEPYFILDTQDFRSVKNGLLELEVADENGMAEIPFLFVEANVSVRLNAGEENGGEFTEVSWNFGGNTTLPEGTDWRDLVTLTRIRGNSSVDLLDDPAGSFVFENGILTWTASSAEYCVQTGDTLKTVLNVEGLTTESGIPFANTQTVDGNESVTKDFKVNLQVSAQSQITLRKTSSVVDGTVAEGTAPESESWLHEWNTVWVEVWGSVFSSDEENGMKTYSALITFDPQLFDPWENGEATVLWDEVHFESVTVSAVENMENTLRIEAVAKAEAKVGRVDSSSETGSAALIASICFKPAAGVNSGVELELENGEPISQTAGLKFVADSIRTTDLNGSSIQAEDATGVLPKVHPVPYDLNDDGSVGIEDLVLLSQNWGKDSESDMAVFCDFDASGSVEIRDLVLFAQNFGKSRVDVTLGSGLIENWENATVAVSLDVGPTAFVAIDALSENSSSLEKEVEKLEDVEIAVAENSTVSFGGMNGNTAWTDWTALVPVGLREAEELNSASLFAVMDEAEGESVSSSISVRSADESAVELLQTLEFDQAVESEPSVKWSAELSELEWVGIWKDILNRASEI